MTLNKNTKILIVGLGVIGGGYAKALKNAGFSFVDCITKDEADLVYARERGMIRYGTTKVDEKLIGQAELIIFALYPTVFIEWVEKHGHLIQNGTLVTDVTGVKTEIVRRVQGLLPKGVEFISAHPMAGRERSGVEYSDETVFQSANYIVTPTENNTRDAIDTCKRLGEILGFSCISELSVEEHDEMIAFLSQLTHCIAVTLMTCNNTENLEKYTGDSFRDLTRIAKINDRMWSELFLMNREALLAQMDAFAKEFQAFRAMLSEGDAEGMRQKMRLSTERRLSFDKK